MISIWFNNKIVGDFLKNKLKIKQTNHYFLKNMKKND